MQDLKLLLIQHDTAWHNPKQNRDSIEKLISKSGHETDLIILPEMFSTGFSMESDKLAEDMNGPTHQWMIEQAEKHKAAVCGSLIINEAGKFFNRFIWVESSGQTLSYDKRHLFRMADEHDHYSAGVGNIIIDFHGWKIRPQVCYDLRFPVWARNKLVNEAHEYDILINVANWPEVRVSAWDALLKARAIENHAYTIGVNRVGKDGKGINYCGHSGIYDPKGNALAFLERNLVAYATTLNYDDLSHYRQNFPAQLDADDFEIHG